jgi:glutamine synthetase
MTKLEYIWIDGTEDAPQLRSKTKVVEHHEWDGSVANCPVWGFDGSSTNQAPGDNSDCVLKPVRIYENPLEENSHLVMCEVWNADDTPHETNTRRLLEETITDVEDDIDEWVGFEQEYTLYKNRRPLGWPQASLIDNDEPYPQGDYYCGRNAGENISREHMNACIDAGISICGTNAEVMLGQWEYQIGAGGSIHMSDDLWVARWLMERICEKHGLEVILDPKPIPGDWNGAGCHINSSPPCPLVYFVEKLV